MIRYLKKLQDGGDYVNSTLELEQALNSGKQLINLVPNKEYIITKPLTIDYPHMTLNGNGAILTRATDVLATESFTTLVIIDEYVTVKDVVFQGLKSTIQGNVYTPTHNGIVVFNGNNVTIDNCTFKLFLGNGLSLCSNGSVAYYPPRQLYFGSKNWDYFNGAAEIINNRFIQCYIGMSNIFRFEYSTSSNNRFYKCAIGLWDESGNWIHGNNSSSKCNHGFITNCFRLRLQFYHKRWDANPNTSEESWFQFGNSAHGNINGFSSNHSIDQGTSIFGGTAIILISNNQSVDMTNHLGGKGCGVVGWGNTDRVIPPNLNNLTLYYSSLYIRNIMVPITSNFWNIVNVVVSGQSATNRGVIKNYEAGQVRCFALTRQNANVLVENVVIV